MLQLEVFVLELGAVDALAAGAVMVGEIAALAHEVRDNPVEGRSLIAEPLLSGAQGTEVLCRLWDDVGA